MMTDKEDKQYKLSVLAKTWARDSHGLYDYETTSMKITNLDISFNCKFIRRKNDVKCHSLNHIKSSEDETELFQVDISNNKVTIMNSINYGMIPSEENIKKLQDKLWFVIRSEDLVQNNTLNNNQNITNTNEIVY